MGADNSKQQPMFRKLTPDERKRNDKRRKRVQAKQNNTQNNIKPVTVSIRPTSMISVTSGDQQAMTDLDKPPKRPLQRPRALEPLPKVPPIQRQSNDVQSYTGAKRPKLRPPPPSAQVEVSAPVLERNMTLLSVASTSDSVSQLTPRGHAGYSIRNGPTTTSRALQQSNGYNRNQIIPSNSLTPIDSHHSKSQPPQNNSRFAAQKTAVNVTSMSKPTAENSNKTQLIERNMTLVSLMSEY